MREKTLASQTIYQGKIVTLRIDEVGLPNGKRSTREIVEHPGAVAVVPLLDSGEVVMVKQFRKPVERLLYEIPAGKLEKGENPLLCAQRELLEETGLEAKKWIKLCQFYTTPGFSNEIMHLFLARELVVGPSNLEDDEFLEVERIPLEKLANMLKEGKIQDAKTIIGLLWLLGQSHLGEKNG